MGDPSFEVTSIQSSMERYNSEAILLRQRSAQAGRKWAILGDEQNPASAGVVPDQDDPSHDGPRENPLWGNLMGGEAYAIHWYDPRAGGALQRSSIKQIDGPGWRSVGTPPNNSHQDWAVLVCKPPVLAARRY